MSVLEEAAVQVASSEAALGGAVWLAGGLPLAILAARKSARLWPWREEARPTWGLPELLVAVFVYLLVQQLAGLALARVFPGELEALEGGELRPELLLGMLVALTLSLAAVGVAAWTWSRRGDGLASLGLRRGRNVRAAAIGVMAWVLCTPALIGLGAVWPWMLERMGGTYEPQQWATGIEGVEGGLLVVVALLAAVVIPVLEELVFRGFLQPLLVRWAGVVGGVGLTSVLFARLHGEGAFLPILALAVLLGAVKERTQRLSSACAIHIVYNGLQVAILVTSSS